MSYYLIYEPLFEHIKNKYPKKNVNKNIGRSWHDYRYIQVSTPINDENVHYEYSCGYVCLHFEGEAVSSYKDLIDHLIESIDNDDMFEWDQEDGLIEIYYCQQITGLEQLDAALDAVVSMFDQLINEYLNKSSSSFSNESLATNDFLSGKLNTVELVSLKLEEILLLPLSIPEYQRIYCWGKHHVLCLLDDIICHSESRGIVRSRYRLGTIILHYHDNRYDIIDGQQRLITLALVLLELGIVSPLLHQKIYSTEAIKNIAHNKYLIHNKLDKNRTKITKDILNMIDFSVLILNNTSIDLAYTFFSNENSRGVVLSDYDLLKAHHLRFIPQINEQQSMRAAETWNKMIKDGRLNAPEDEKPDFERTLDTYIYCLRKWMRLEECEQQRGDHHVKKEFEAAPIIEEIPPFGEQFYFNEPIQGGCHFFSFVEHHLSRYKHFSNTKAFKSLHITMSYSSHIWYRDAVEALLFCYYVKFGDIFLADALTLIMRVVLQHRYENKRASRQSILNYIGDKKFVMMLNQATSPTFFFANLREMIRNFPNVYIQQLKPIQYNLKKLARLINKDLNSDIIVESFKNLNK